MGAHLLVGITSRALLSTLSGLPLTVPLLKLIGKRFCFNKITLFVYRFAIVLKQAYFNLVFSS